MATRNRGGQPSNTNALRHGFYSKKLDAELLPQLAEAAQVEGLDQEISILRLKLRTLVNGRSTQEAALALDCANTLARLIKTRYAISIDHNETLKNAIAQVLTEIAAPLKIKKLIR